MAWRDMVCFTLGQGHIRIPTLECELMYSRYVDGIDNWIVFFGGGFFWEMLDSTVIHKNGISEIFYSIR